MKLTLRLSSLAGCVTWLLLSVLLLIPVGNGCFCVCPMGRWFVVDWPRTSQSGPLFVKLKGNRLPMWLPVQSLWWTDCRLLSLGKHWIHHSSYGDHVWLHENRALAGRLLKWWFVAAVSKYNFRFKIVIFRFVHLTGPWWQDELYMFGGCKWGQWAFVSAVMFVMKMLKDVLHKVFAHSLFDRIMSLTLNKPAWLFSLFCEVFIFCFTVFHSEVRSYSACGQPHLSYVVSFLIAFCILSLFCRCLTLLYRLYVSPKKQMDDQGPESPLKWCRQALDHRSPETEIACRTLISRLDQSMWTRKFFHSQSLNIYYAVFVFIPIRPKINYNKFEMAFKIRLLYVMVFWSHVAASRDDKVRALSKCVRAVCVSTCGQRFVSDTHIIYPARSSDFLHTAEPEQQSYSHQGWMTTWSQAPPPPSLHRSALLFKRQQLALKLPFCIETPWLAVNLMVSRVKVTLKSEFKKRSFLNLTLVYAHTYATVSSQSFKNT